MHAVRLTLIGMVMVTVLAAPAKALLITQTRSFSDLSFTSRTGPADQTLAATFAFDAFDPLLGEFQNATLRIDGFITFNGTVTCPANVPVVLTCANVIARAILNAAILDPFLALLDRRVLAEPLVAVLQPGEGGNGGLSVSGGSFTVQIDDLASALGVSGTFPEGPFASGPVTIGLETFSGFAASSIVTTFLNRNEIQGTATLTYEFTERAPAPVSAPPTLATMMTGLALAGLAVHHGRRRHRPCRRVAKVPARDARRKGRPPD